MSKLVYFFLVLFILLSVVNAQYVPDIERLRCIPNNHCDYFETEHGCPSDCNLEALQLQRELQRGSSLLTRVNEQIPVETPLLRKKIVSPYIFYVLFILLLLSFFIGSYRWIHGKGLMKHSFEYTKKQKHAEKAEVTGGAIMKKSSFSNTHHLPEQPQRRWR